MSVPIRLACALAAAWLASSPLRAQVTPTPVPFAQTQDTLANPIRMGCGERVDPVGYVLYLRDDLGLSGQQVTELQSLEDATRAVTRPLAEQWRARREGLQEIREAYRGAMSDMKEILTDEQFADAMRPVTATKVSGRSRGMVRCLFRSHLAIVS